MLIIGAGISGLEAARLLGRNGIETIVLEGRNRTGGRMWSVQMKNDHTIDMGAAWIHGIHGSIPGGLLSNPLWDLTQEARIDTRPTETDDLHVFHSTENDSFDPEYWYGEYVAYVKEQTREPGANGTLQHYADAFVQLHGLSVSQTELFFSYLHIIIENEEAAELDTISGKDVFVVSSNHAGVEHVFHKTGYKALIDYMAKDVEDIRLEQVVTKISYGNGLAEVRTADNHLYQAQFVLVTVPLGVLKAGTIEFDPPLPKWKTDAIQRIGYGLLDKAVLLWDEAWWDLKEYFFLRVASKRSEYSFWVNANKWNDRPALICYFIGKEAYRLETELTSAEVIEEVRQALQKMFPDRVVPPPIDGFMTHWKLDPFSNGSYSFISINQRRDDPFYLAEPLADQLLFAGEATRTEDYGYAQGALMSGRREVTRLLYDYELMSDRAAINARSTALLLIVSLHFHQLFTSY